MPEPTQELIDSFGDWKGGYNESGGFDGVSEYDRDGNYVGPMPDNAGSSGTDSTDSSDESENDNSDETDEGRMIQKMTVTAMSLTENMMDGIPDTQMKVITNSRIWRIIVKKV